MVNKKVQIVTKYVMLQVGALIAAFSLEEFLVPNNLIDGGIVGISIISSYLSKLPLGIFLIVLNLPFVLFAYKKLGKEFVAATIYSIISLAFWVTLFRDLPQITDDLVLAAIFGGIILGLGIGLIIRNGGSLDGTEIIALTINEQISFSVGEIVLFLNIFIFGAAGFVFGWDRAMYSLATYLAAYKVIDIVVEGLDTAKAIYIISNESELIRSEIIKEFNRGVTVFMGKGGYSDENREILYFVIKRSELYKLKQLVNSIDESAFISISNIHELIGKNIKSWKKK